MIVILPVRSRPRNLERFIESWINTGTRARLIVAADADDPTLKEYKGLQAEFGNFELSVAPYMMLGPKLNHHVMRVVDEDNLIGFLADDLICRTMYWHEKMERALRIEGGTGVLYPNDTIQGANLPTHAFLSSDIIKALGYMAPPQFVHLFIDNAWKTIGEALGKLFYQADIVMEHMHPVAGKAEWDDLYRSANSGQRWQEDQATFDAWRSKGEYLQALSKAGLL